MQTELEQPSYKYLSKQNFFLETEVKQKDKLIDELKFEVIKLSMLNQTLKVELNQSKAS